MREGLNAIIDAAFLRKADRNAAKALAKRRGISIVFVEAHARDSELITRLKRRKAASTDASEADIDVLRYQVASADALTDDELGSTVRIATDDEVDADSVVKRINAIRG